jgi:hypothetical protein
MAINTDPVNGETPLTGATPSGWGTGDWTGTGGGDKARQYYAWQDFAKQFGRNPTQSELSMLAPNYASGDPNKTNNSAGAGAIASYYNSLANTPTNIAANQTATGLKAYQAGQSGFDATTTAAFQQATGRAPTADEMSHFGGLLASGAIDSYGMSQLIGQTAEAQNKQTADYQNTLSSNLQSTQGDYFKNYINPSILSQTAAAGRDPNSSGVQQAEVQAGKQQNYDLQNYLANFGAGQYSQSAAVQQGVYGQYLNQQYGLQNAGISQQLGQQSYMQQQNTNMQNYSLQQNSYNQYLSRYGNRNNGIGGGITGALTGALSGYKANPTNPWGAVLGGVAGGAGGYASGGGQF